MRELPKEKIYIGPNDRFGLPNKSNIPPQDIEILSAELARLEEKLVKRINYRRKRSKFKAFWDKYFTIPSSYELSSIKDHLLNMNFECNDDLVGLSGRKIFERGDVVVKFDVRALGATFPDQLHNSNESRAVHRRQGEITICFPIYWISDRYSFLIMKQADEVPYRKYGISSVPIDYPKSRQVEAAAEGYVNDPHPFNFGIIMEDGVRYWGILDLDVGE